MKLPRFLNPKKEKDQVQMLRRMMGRGFAQVSPETMARIMAEKSEKNMVKEAKKAVRKGETPTVESLTAELKGRPDFMAFCKEDLGLDMAFFEGLAEKAIKEVAGA